MRTRCGMTRIHKSKVRWNVLIFVSRQTRGHQTTTRVLILSDPQTRTADNAVGVVISYYFFSFYQQQRIIPATAPISSIFPC